MPRPELCAVSLKDGEQLWSLVIENEYTGGTFAVKGSHLVYHSTSGLTCVDSASGKVVWAEPVPIPAAPALTKEASRAL